MNAHLSPDRAERIRRFFDRLKNLHADERPAFFTEACRRDPALKRELTSLLDHPEELARIDPEAADIVEPLLREPVTGPDQPRGLVGLTVSHYRIVERLGGGGMGVVYKARDTRLDRTVALKFLPPELTRDPAANARFVQEAKAASALDHSNICTIHEIAETAEGQLFIAMSYYLGETLQAKIERGPLPVEEALGYAVQMARGLSRAHAAGITHRDIKPANIMVIGPDELKIVDFGLAKVAGQTQLTKTGTTIGTAAYMSPEQARGETVDDRTDIWSSGAVLYEMLTGQRPFRGDYPQAVIYSILHETPEPLKRLNPAVPAELEQIVDRALQKEPEARYDTAAAFASDLDAYQRSLRAVELGAFDLQTLLRRARRPRVAVPTIGVLAVVLLGSAWFVDRQAKVRWARETALPEIERLVEASWRDYSEAYSLAERAERYIPNDSDLAALLATSSLRINVRTEPAGAAVYMKAYQSPESEWKHVGISPIDSLRVPIGVMRWKIEKEGYETVLAAASTWDRRKRGGLDPNDLVRVLDEQGSAPDGMVRVAGAETPYGHLEDFFIDRHEVTNRQYKAFIDSGGYQNRAYWQHEFVRDGEVLTSAQAMAEFVDRTGRPGPSTWQAGDYPEGQDEYPVSGISWYEAAAYAEFAGKSLPTAVHWGAAGGEYTPLGRYPQLGGAAVYVPFSNFRSDGPVPVGHLPGFSTYGAYDMSGNVREWCWNETAGGRLLRGGAWTDHNMFRNLSQASPFDRSASNGFRCAHYPDSDRIPAPALGSISPPATRDYYQEKPVSDDVFAVYRAQFAYDKTDLNPRIESRDESSDDWIHERVSVDAAYGSERLILHLFLPRNAAPPYQTVIYFPGSGSLFQDSSENIQDYIEFRVFLSFLVKNGRAVLYPVYKGTFERQDMDAARVHIGDDSYRYTEYLTMWVKDFRRSIDYLEMRQDVDESKLAFYGMSWGGMMGTIIPAVEDRLKASILAPAALMPRRRRPEADQINYITRIEVPTLMLNGRFDSIAPVEKSVLPLYELLGTPAEHKELKLYDTDHIPPRTEYIKEILVWLDRYLGPT